MPTTANPEAVYLIAQRLLQCALDKVEDTWAEDEALTIARACVVWGEIAWDDCECGQLVVSIGRQFPSNEFPFEAGSGVGTSTGGVSRQSRCGSPVWVTEYTVSILRCAPIQDDEGNPPPCADLDVAARVASIDSWAVRSGVACCLQDLRTERLPNGSTEIHDFLITQQLSTGPAGACAGSDLTVQVGLRNCFCPKESS